MVDKQAAGEAKTKNSSAKFVCSAIWSGSGYIEWGEMQLKIKEDSLFLKSNQNQNLLSLLSFQ